MFYIFQDISDFKTFIGGGANVSINMKSIAPTIQSTAEKHLKIWLGAQLTEVVGNIDDPSIEQEKLLHYIKRPLAMLTMYEYSDIGGIQFNEAGIQRVETDRMKSAYKYQENAYRRHMLEYGYEAIETMLVFLEENRNDYPTWETDEAFERATGSLLNFATDFRTAYSSYISRYTFDLLRPLIEDLICFAIEPLIGEAQIEVLKLGYSANTLSQYDQQAIKLIHKVLANFAIEEGMKRHWVRLEGKNVVQTELLGDQSHEKSASAGAQPFALSVRTADEWANRHISKLKKYLNDNLDHFPTYKAFLEEQAAAAEEEKKCAAQLPCGCWHTCTCNQKRAIVRL